MPADVPHHAVAFHLTRDGRVFERVENATGMAFSDGAYADDGHVGTVAQGEGAGDHVLSPQCFCHLCGSDDHGNGKSGVWASEFLGEHAADVL